MSEALEFDLSYDPAPGVAETVAPGVRRILAPNPSPFTFRGTNTYLVGTGDVAVIDPGPDNPDHLAAIEHALGEERLAAILITHTHRDHSPLAAALKARHDVPTYGHGPYRPARPPHPGEDQRLDASNDTDFTPDTAVADGDTIAVGDHRLTGVFTPGHTTNHMAFALEGTGLLFSGDHVMGWSTSIVAPPDGDMAQYMASLDRLIERDDTLYLSGHGGPIREPQRFTRLLALHRRQRETAILKRLQAGDRLISDIVDRIYKGLNPGLKGAAGLSVLAHLEDLIGRGIVENDGEPGLAGSFRPR